MAKNDLERINLDAHAGWMRMPDGTAKKARTWLEYKGWLDSGSNFIDLRRANREAARALAENAKAVWGRRLKAWRESKGLTRRELGFFVDLTEDTLRMYEEGRVTAGVRKAVDPPYFLGVFRLALALGVTPVELMGADPPRL